MGRRVRRVRRTSGQVGVPWARRRRMGRRVWGGSGGVSSSRLNWEEGKGLDYFV